VARNRQEERSIEVFDYDPLQCDLPDDWDKNLKQIIRCIRIRKVRDTKEQKRNETLEWCYYISTTRMSAEEYIKIIR